MPPGDRVGEAYVDIHVNAGPGEAELAAFKAKVDRDFEELARKKAEAELKLKSVDFDRKIDDAKSKLDYFKSRRASATLDLAKKHFDAEIAAAEAELKALTSKKRTIQLDSRQVRAANDAERLLAKERALNDRAALQSAKAERALSNERQRATTDAIKSRAEIARLSEQYEKLRGRQVALEKSSRRVFSSGSIAKAEAEARKLERVSSEAEYVKHRIEQLGGSVEHLDPQLSRNTSMLDRWLSRLGDTSIRLGPITTSIKGLATGLGLLGPIIFELGGGLVSLVGTLGEGLAGGATVAAGALAGLATSAAGVGFVIGPMVGEFKEVFSAAEALHKAVLKYGKGSEQAATYQERLNNELHGVSPIAREAFEDYGNLKTRWKELTKAARPAVFNAFGESLKTVQSLLPGFARESTKTTQVAGKAWDSWMKSLRSSEAKQILGSIMSDFRASIPGISTGIGSLVAMLGRLSAAGAHFLPGLSNGFAEWAANLEHAVGGGAKLQSGVGRLVGQMRDLGHLTQHTGSLIVHVFDASANSGDGLVKSLDHVVQRWDKWTQSASGKQGLAQFFDESKTATEDFFASLSHLTKLLFEFSRATAPVANGLLKVVTWIGDIVSAADNLVGVKQIFQGIGIVLAGLFVASKVLTYADALKDVAVRLGVLRGVSTAAAAATEVEAAAAASAATALEAESVAATEATVATGALEGTSFAAALDAGAAASTRAALGLEGTAESAGVLSAALAPEVLIPAGLIAGFGVLVASNLDTTSGFEDLEQASQQAGKAMQNSLGRSASTVDRYVAAQHRSVAATNEVSKARAQLVKLQKNNAPLQKITAAVEKLNEAEHHQAAQAHETGVINRQQIKSQKAILSSAQDRVKTAKEAIRLIHQEIAFKNEYEGGLQESQQIAYRKQLAAAERQLAHARSEVAQAQRQEAASAVPYERSIKNLAPISQQAERGLHKLAETIGAAATKKIGQFVNPKDVARITELGNRLTKLGRGGEVKNIAVKSQGADQTIAKLQKLQRQTNRVEGARATIKVGANDAQAQSKLKRLAALSQRVVGAQQTIHILANASSAEQAINRLRGHLQDVAQRKYEAKITAIDNTKGASDAAKTKLREAAGRKYTARITAIDDASSKAKKAEGAGKSAAKQYKLNITASNAQALGAISSVQSALAGLHDKTVSVNVVTHKSGGFSGGPAATFYSTFAQGGISDRELKRANEKATTRQSGPSFRVNRPTMLVGEQAPQHPEYVIATNPAFRSSNEQYLKDAAGEFGYEVVPAYKKGKGAKGKKGGGGGSKSGGETQAEKTQKTLAHHPPKPKHRSHKIAKVEKWGPVAAYNAAETDAQIKEEVYGQVFAHDEAEIRAGRMDQWEFSRLRQLLSEQAADYRKLGGLVPDIRTTVNTELGRIHGLVDGKGEFSKKSISSLNKELGKEKAKLSKLKKGKNESDASFRKRKRPFEHAITKMEVEMHKKEKERDRLIEIRGEAKQELSEVTGARKMNEARINAERSEDELQYIEDVETGAVEAPYEEAAEAVTPEMEYAKAALVHAELEHNTAAEESIRKQMVEIAEREYSAALGTPSPADDIEKGEQLKQLREEAATNGGRGTIGEQTASYNEARAQLYQEFASNIFGQLTPTAAPGVPAIGASGGTPTYAPSGMNSLAAATPALHAGSTRTPGTGKIEVVNNFAAPPPDPHTWARQQEFELGALA